MQCLGQERDGGGVARFRQSVHRVHAFLVRPVFQHGCQRADRHASQQRGTIKFAQGDEEDGLQGWPRPKRRGQRGRPALTPPGVRNLLERDFHADLPSRKWVTDVTEFSLFGQKVYLSPILDLCHGELVSYSIGYSPNFYMVADMLGKAFEKIPDGTNLILHSDQGWQYQMKRYQYMLRKKGIRQSMSRKGNCLDNAVMENFFGILKSEFYYNKKFSSIEQFSKELSDYIHYYNNRRIKVKLKGLSPVQFRTQSFIPT